MSLIFKDEKYESLDWISQATELVESPLNEILAELPDESPITFKTLMSPRYGFRNTFTVPELLNPLSTKLGVSSYQDRNTIYSCFEIQVEPGTYIDIEKEVIIGHAALVKIKHSIDDDKLRNIIGHNALATISNLSYTGDREGSLPRLNELLEFFIENTNLIKNTKKPFRYRFRLLYSTISDIFKSDKWRIRDHGLATKIGNWVHDYVVDGNVCALANLTRLKIMASSGKPIYSIVEAK